MTLGIRIKINTYLKEKSRTRVFKIVQLKKTGIQNKELRLYI